MLKGISSLTAIGVTFLRAAATNSPDTQVFDDPYAEQFLPYPLRRLTHRPRFHRHFARAVGRRPILQALMSVLVRARYTEDQLVQAMNEGVRQYVILGAGWDSFVVRRPDLVAELKVFELDHPATQNAKRRRLAKRSLCVPENVTFIPIDFQRQSIGEELLKNGFDPSLPTFVNWLGVTYYLPIDIVADVFEELADLCEGGVDVVFDYLDARYHHNRTAIRSSQWLMRLLRSIGEPLGTAFDAEELACDFNHMGYIVVEDLVGPSLRHYVPAEELGPFQPRGYIHVAHVHAPPQAAPDRTHTPPTTSGTALAT
ncbi:MAG: class I SAM-dependent methyltransferase [Pseudomonadota bacterium]|nr:class I SAM-dependent methyltransferase [Pseudomonadota bacterium]